MDIIVKKITAAKITIAEDNIRIKFPLEYSEHQKGLALKCFNDLIEKFPYKGQTMRGHLSITGAICLRYNDSSFVEGSDRKIDLNIL